MSRKLLPNGAQKRKEIQKAINELVAASQEFGFIGAQPPSAHDYIQARFKAAKLNLALLSGAICPTRELRLKLHSLQVLVDEGYEGPTEEERGG